MIVARTLQVLLKTFAVAGQTSHLCAAADCYS